MNVFARYGAMYSNSMVTPHSRTGVLHCKHTSVSLALAENDMEVDSQLNLEYKGVGACSIGQECKSEDPIY